jgi:phosphoribosylanthranilate isomerase
MNQRPLLYVHRITNLSDARYCAGMGVDMLGFVVDPSDQDYVTPKLYQDMVGWISGPKRVIAWPSITSPDWDDVLETYKPDLLHIPFGLLNDKVPTLPLILEVELSALSEAMAVLPSHSHITHLLISDGWKTSNLPSSIAVPILLEVHGTVNAVELLARTGASGLALQGTPEVAPGLKDYDHLSAILNGLES